MCVRFYCGTRSIMPFQWCKWYTLNFRLDSLLHWVNCDGLASLPGTKTAVMGYFAEHFNASTSSNYEAKQQCMLFFKPAIEYAGEILQCDHDPPAGYEGLHSYQTSIPPAGLEGTLAMSSVVASSTAQMKDVTIGTADAITSVTFNPRKFPKPLC